MSHFDTPVTLDLNERFAYDASGSSGDDEVSLAPTPPLANTFLQHGSDHPLEPHEWHSFVDLSTWDQNSWMGSNNIHAYDLDTPSASSTSPTASSISSFNEEEPRPPAPSIADAGLKPDRPPKKDKDEIAPLLTCDHHSDALLGPDFIHSCNVDMPYNIFTCPVSTSSVKEEASTPPTLLDASLEPSSGPYDNDSEWGNNSALLKAIWDHDGLLSSNPIHQHNLARASGSEYLNYPDNICYQTPSDDAHVFRNRMNRVAFPFTRPLTRAYPHLAMMGPGPQVERRDPLGYNLPMNDLRRADGSSRDPQNTNVKRVPSFMEPPPLPFAMTASDRKPPTSLHARYPIQPSLMHPYGSLSAGTKFELYTQLRNPKPRTPVWVSKRKERALARNASPCQEAEAKNSTSDFPPDLQGHSRSGRRAVEREMSPTVGVQPQLSRKGQKKRQRSVDPSMSNTILEKHRKIVVDNPNPLIQPAIPQKATGSISKTAG